MANDKISPRHPAPWRYESRHLLALEEYQITILRMQCHRWPTVRALHFTSTPWAKSVDARLERASLNSGT